MWRKLIGSSNVYRVYSHDLFKDYPKFEMVKCTKKEIFKTALDNIGDGKGEVVISVIENFICDAVNGITDPNEINKALEGIIGEYLALVQAAAEKRPQASFALTQPTLRPLHQWYMDCHEALCKELGEGIRRMDKKNVGKIDAPIRMSQMFEQDGVHFTPSSGKVFVTTMLFNADTFFNTEIVELVEDMDTSSSKVSEDTKSKIGKRITLVEREVANLKEDILRRRENDCLVTARIREELDFQSNTKKEDRIVITGLTSKIPSPASLEEKKKWLRDIVGEILNRVETGAAEHILNVVQGWNGRNSIPLAEVRMDSAVLAGSIRKQFATKKRGGHDFGKIYMANSTTLGTRVRVEILKAMAKCFATEREVMYVSAFSSRPLLHVKPKEAGTRQMAFTFADAVSRYGERLRQSDLGEAYRRAGNSFNGQLQQNFVVLYDSQPEGAQGEQRSSGPRVWVASGRPQAKRKLPAANPRLEGVGLEKKTRQEKSKQN